MKARSLKKKLINAVIRKVVAKQNDPIIVKHTADPFALLFKDIKPIEERTEDDDEVEVVVEKKQRGRPKKWNIEIPAGLHNMDNNKIVTTSKITHAVKQKMVADFRKMYLEQETSVRTAVNTISEKYGVEYQQAHYVLEAEF